MPPAPTLPARPSAARGRHIPNRPGLPIRPRRTVCCWMTTSRVQAPVSSRGVSSPRLSITSARAVSHSEITLQASFGRNRQNPLLVSVAGGRPRSNFIEGAKASGTKACLHLAHIDARRGHHRRQPFVTDVSTGLRCLHRALGKNGVCHARRRLALQQLRNPRAGVDQRIEIDAGIDAQAAQQPDHVFRRDIA